MTDGGFVEFIVGADESVPVRVPADDVSLLIEGMQRLPAGAATGGSSAADARRLLERTLDAPAEPCRLDGFSAWEVLWAIQSLADEQVSPALGTLRGRLWTLTSGRRTRVAGAATDGSPVTRLR